MNQTIARIGSILVTVTAALFAFFALACVKRGYPAVCRGV